ncbi:MAG: SH3 domain-containing protein [Anaerolineales bacterium]|nr:SH3 domain-containing protein [Anaerolineales bacterium]
MNNLNHRFAHKRWLLKSALLTLLVSVATLLWVGTAQVWAAEHPADVKQNSTVPPRPPTETPAPPAPTERPRDDDKRDEPAQPTPTPTAAANQPAPAPDAPGDALTGVISAATLNMRQGPGATFPVIGRLTSGALVTVLARNSANTWLNICCLPSSQTQGWVSAQFVTPNYTAEQLAGLPVGDGATLVAGETALPPVTAPPVTTPAVTAPVADLPPGAPVGKVAVVALNVREEPSTSAPILGKLGSGATVTLLGRNAAGDWWLVCCVPGGIGNGWVSAQFVTTDTAAATLAALPVTTGRDAPVVATPAAATPTSAPETVESTSLLLSSAMEPAVAMQGDQIVLSFTLTNTGTAAAANPEFSFELPVGLSFVSLSATDGGEATQKDADSGALLIVVTWPELSAGVATTVKLTAAIDEELAAGAVLDGSAAALAANAEPAFTAISVGMPPAEPPDFQ